MCSTALKGHPLLHFNAALSKAEELVCKRPNFTSLRPIFYYPSQKPSGIQALTVTAVIMRLLK